jgi:hypothetical protein
VGGKLTVLIPEEIRQLYHSLELGDFWEQWERRRLILDYIIAAVNLYGVCGRSKVLEIFYEQNAEATTAEAAKNINSVVVLFYS